MKHDTIIDQPVIETERLILRPLRKSDVGRLEMHSNDERVAKMTPSIPHPMPPGAADALIQTSHSETRTEDMWAVDGSNVGLGELLGIISLEQMDREQSEVSYWIAPALWNTGLASEAVKGLVDANPHKDKTMFASVFQDNPASGRVLTNNGFEYLGDAETFAVARGAPVPTWTYLKRLG